MKKIFYTAKFEYLKWIFDEKQIVTIVGIVFMHVMIIQPFLNRSEEMQTPVNIVEVFLAVANSKMFLLILPVLFLVIISDFPRIDSDALFFIMRSGRINWLIGQMFFLIKAVMSYLGIIIAYTLLIGAIHGYIGNGWSLTVTNYQDFYGAEAVCYIPVELYWQMPPYEAFLKSVFLIFGYFILTGMGLLLFSIYDLKKIGFAIVTAILAIGTAAAAAGFSVMWLFPTAHAILEKHFDTIKRTQWPDIVYSLLYDFLLVFMLIVIATKKMKHKKIISIEEN